MFKVGTVCMKIAGRDAGNLCVIIGEPKDGRVLVDGGVRRKACNVRHIEPTGKHVNVKANASHEEVAKALGLEPRKKTEKKSSVARPKTARSAMQKAPAAEKPAKPKKAAAPKAAKPKTQKKEEKKDDAPQDDA